MSDVPTQETRYTPPLDHSAVLAAHNKLTVLLMLAVEKDADEPDHVASMRFAEDRRSLMEISEVRWWDVQDTVEALLRLVMDRSQPDHRASGGCSISASVCSCELAS